MAFSGGSDSKQSACNAGDQGWIPESRRPPEKGMLVETSYNANILWCCALFSLPTSRFSKITLGCWNQLWWGYLTTRNITNQTSNPQPPRQLLTLTVALRGNKKWLTPCPQGAYKTWKGTSPNPSWLELLRISLKSQMKGVRGHRHCSRRDLHPHPSSATYWPCPLK